MVLKDLEKRIKEADMVIVGTGSQLSAKKLIPYDSKEIIDFYKEQHLLDYEQLLEESEDEYLEYMKETAYNYYLLQLEHFPLFDELARMLEGKEYFVITSNTDDLIYKSLLDPMRIVSPCGSIAAMQCQDACNEQLFPSKDMLLAQIKEFAKGEEQSKISCGSCKKPLIYNTRTKETKSVYNESGYLPQWGKYTKWLQGTLNKNFLVLELGEGFENPNLFRWPFEKIVFFNEKARLVRVHENLYQAGEELKDKVDTVKMNPVDFLQN